MFDIGKRTGSGDWDKTNNDGLEKGDGDSGMSGQGDENVKPQFGDDHMCRNCGGIDHFARNCLDADYHAGHHNGGGLGGYSQGACFNCNEEGHSKADCPRPPQQFGTCYNRGEEGHSKADYPATRKASGACFNCGQEGHSKTECPNPKVFTGTCNFCGTEGHPAALCPLRDPIVCKNCHSVKDCKGNRKFDMFGVEDKTSEEAWAMMKGACDGEMDDFRKAIQVYSKACPAATYLEIAKRMHEEKFKVYLIGLENPNQADNMTLIDLQGQLDRQYLVGLFRSQKLCRKALKGRWPENQDENMDRLGNAGLPYDRLVVKCRNCEELGHIAKHCPEEAREVSKVEIICLNCNNMGHRVRDCPQPRKSKHCCRNCGVEGHQARECPEPRSAADVKCRNCGDTGHFAKDCTQAGGGGARTCRNCGSESHLARECDQARNLETIQCHNCDEMGHPARECPMPKDWSKVKCNRCNEMGHTVRRCPLPEDSGENEYGGYSHGNPPLNHTWDSTNEVTEQFGQLNTSNANVSGPSW
ncbi:Zinc knuckle CX2CX4HX4C [Penicillium atrosanguineum]|uniref:Zinc knuckle CX2CX4HX4C n=1 Tax=Penicillium atrosanguineum TaxID=1132637 RepID=A0A9W9PRK5_9EURO|nr:uncharacterized protein N7443_008550 [Penicillium atrosanguineum]KAJ5125480.1 Zinc knuckle CX2CX4HX4C [Penicillium atrosanguineum]KAJ5136246.1 Zinc knuckle CX2CX4HX4C [Penicillium atrosanguineum]KAJ5292597.1 hypothetical protein N7443_008550 [Penicillium atrosanguineum]KAJ5303379.1 Zinc knuckle CX2CX4HX4C [Penicillium atrosanguineum]